MNTNNEYERIRDKVSNILGSGVVNSTSQYRGKGVVKSTRTVRGKGVVNGVEQYQGGKQHKHRSQHLGNGMYMGSGLFDFLKNIPIVGDMASMGENMMSQLPVVGSMMGSMLGNGKPRKKRVVSPKMKERQEMIKVLMHKKGLTLPQASKYLKENGF
jgi:hypothetical protein